MTEEHPIFTTEAHFRTMPDGTTIEVAPSAKGPEGPAIFKPKTKPDADEGEE